MREKYSSKKEFSLYAVNEYKKIIKFPPPPPVLGKTKKLFKIPWTERKKMYPFEGIDSVNIYKQNSSNMPYTIKNLEYLSDILINYYTLRFWDLDISIKNNCDGEMLCSENYKVEFWFIDGSVKHIIYYSNNEIKSDFTENEMLLLDITKEKILLITQNNMR